MRSTEHTKITPVQSENGFNPFAIRQVHKARVGELYLQLLIAGENCGNAREISLVERSKLKEPSTERR